MLNAQGISGSRLEALITSLDSTIDGDLAARELVDCGEQAIPFLASFLYTPPRALPHARKRAVKALAELGAKAALLDYLDHPPEATDLVVQLAESEVESLAARELSRWKSPEVEKALLRAARRHLTLGVVYALGELRSVAALPVLVHALGDDTCHTEAEEALRRSTVQIRDYLIQALQAKARTPTDVRRQIRAARLLMPYRLTQSEWIELIPLLSSPDNDLAISIARIGLRSTPSRDWPVLFHNILHSLRGLSWVAEAEVAEELQANIEVALPLVQARIHELHDKGLRVDMTNPEWRILLGTVQAADLSAGMDEPRRA